LKVLLFESTGPSISIVGINIGLTMAGFTFSVFEAYLLRIPSS